MPAFSIDRHNVTNEDFFSFVEAGGYSHAQWWRPEDWAWIGKERITNPLFWERHDGRWSLARHVRSIPLPAAWPAYVVGGGIRVCAMARMRLPTEAEHQRAAYGTSSSTERPFPWGDEEPGPDHGLFDFAAGRHPAGLHPAGRSAWGVDDLVGNGWEWTGSVFEPFPGFVPIPSYPEYSADFFDGEHFVMKGACRPRHASSSVRRSGTGSALSASSMRRSGA